MASVNEARMPLLDHLRELRKRVLRSAIAVLVAFGGGWYFYDSIIVTLAKPVCDLKAAQQSGAASCGALYISGVLGPLDLQIKVALLTGIIVSAPFWLYQLWAFIAPALHRREKRTSVLFVASATPFFAMGATLVISSFPLQLKLCLDLLQVQLVTWFALMTIWISFFESFSLLGLHSSYRYSF